ncbi:MAG TPA: hypothetical protein VFL95_04735 [Gemmatimonadales bacterium]|nr:hypothetical protein [Gemmatimonadales bacterium]
MIDQEAAVFEEQMAVLVKAGLTPDEARLIAERRLRQRAAGAVGRGRGDAAVAICLAVAAAILVKLPALFGVTFDNGSSFYAHNASFFVLPLLTGYFVWKRGYVRSVAWLAVAFILAAVFANIYPFVPNGDTEALSILHLPIALWLAVGIAYAGERWSRADGRMDFIRFSGELFIYYVLIALGGGVFTAFMAMLFHAIGIDAEPFFQSWLLPCGAAGAVIVAAWLVETRQRVMENLAPMLTRLFTPLFAALLVTFLAAMLWTGRGIGVDRDVLIAFDLLLVVVLGLLLYSVSAREAAAPPGAFDVLQVVLLVSALIADVIALWAIAARISEFGFTPNRIAALGENVILLVNLAWSAVLYIGFLRGRGGFERLTRWQTNYLPVYAVWAAIVVIGFPPVFGYR